MATLQPYLLTLPIFLATIYLSLAQPRIGTIRINHAGAALLGALLVLWLAPASSRSVLQSSLEFLFRPVITIISLMIITLIAERAGLFHRLLRHLIQATRGDGRRFFLGLFVTGALAGAVFTNDAAVLILTPLVCLLFRNGLGPHPLPFLFAVLNVANVVGVFVISNPINIVVAEYAGINFVEYAKWMLLPALAAAVSTYGMLRFIFRKEIATGRLDLSVEDLGNRETGSLLAPTAVILSATLILLFLSPLMGIPVWLVTAVGALSLLILAKTMAGIEPGSVIRNVAWDVLIFMVGFFIIVNSLRTTGFSEPLAGLLRGLAGDNPITLIGTTGFLSAVCSALMNNHPTAYMMALTIQDVAASPALQKLLAFAMLIGGDLGPKMLPIGSLAALLWFRILRNHGIEVPYALYIKIGIPVTLVALVLSLLVLIGEALLFGLPA